MAKKKSKKTNRIKAVQNIFLEYNHLVFWMLWQFENKIQKSQMKTLRKVDKLKHCVKTLQGEVTKIEDMLEAIMKAQDIKFQADENI